MEAGSGVMNTRMVKDGDKCSNEEVGVLAS